MKHAGQIGGAEIAEQRRQLVEQSQENQLQGDQPEQDEISLLVESGLHHEIEAHIVGQPKADGELGCIKQEQHQKALRRRQV